MTPSDAALLRQVNHMRRLATSRRSLLAYWDPELPPEEPLPAPDCAVLLADLLAPIDAVDIHMVLTRYPSADPRGEALHDYLLTVLELADTAEPAESDVERLRSSARATLEALGETWRPHMPAKRPDPARTELEEYLAPRLTVAGFFVLGGLTYGVGLALDKVGVPMHVGWPASFWLLLGLLLIGARRFLPTTALSVRSFLGPAVVATLAALPLAGARYFAGTDLAAGLGMLGVLMLVGALLRVVHRLFE